MPKSVTPRHQMTLMKLDLRRKSEPSPRRSRDGAILGDQPRSVFLVVTMLDRTKLLMGGPRSGSM